MKKNTIIFIALLLIQGTLLATDWSKTKGYFKGQQYIDEIYATPAPMATIAFNGTLFNFVSLTGVLWVGSEIVLRKLTYTEGSTPEWSSVKQDTMKNLQNLSKEVFQPAPVIFNDVLYLFVQNKENQICYSKYNEAEDSWSGLTETPITSVVGMAAATVDGKLCLVHKDTDNYFNVLWTEDLTTWNYSGTGLWLDKASHTPMCDYLSAISTSFWINGKKTSKLIFAYIENNKSVTSSDYYFDDNNNLIHISFKTISDDDKYSSVALIEGTVSKDNNSTGKCVQAFLTKWGNDNFYNRSRIKRFQLKDDVWDIAENNLVKQNYLWAQSVDGTGNLTVANLAIPATDGSKDMRQFICLIYEGNNFVHNFLNVAWAETDRLVAVHDKIITLREPINTQYIGYVEGPPPYNLNNKNTYKNDDGYYYGGTRSMPISEVEYGLLVTKDNLTETQLDVKVGLKVKAGWFKAGVNQTLKNAQSNENSITISKSYKWEAKGDSDGYYIVLRPKIHIYFYKIYDWTYYGLSNPTDNPIDTTYCCYMEKPLDDTEDLKIDTAIVTPGKLSSYLTRPRLNNFLQKNNAMTNTSVSWDHSQGGAQTKISVETTSTNTHTKELNISTELGEHFAIGYDGAIEYTMETTSKGERDIGCSTAMNDPDEDDSTDINHLVYDVYWLKPDPNRKNLNWWLHEGAEDQNTWCVTYRVESYNTVDGKLHDAVTKPNDEDPPLFSSISDFSAVTWQSGVNLTWQTLTEEENYGFEIERTSDNIGGIWELVGFVEGEENSDSPKEYSFTDVDPIIGKSSYRLKQINIEKNFVYSSNVEIEFENILTQIATEFELSQNYPNPFNPSTNISFTVPTNGYASLKIFNVLGQEVASLFNGEALAGTVNNVQFNANGLASGIYFSRLEYNGSVLLKKMQLLR